MLLTEQAVVQEAWRSPTSNRRHGIALDQDTLTAAGLRQIIRIQGVVRARMVAKNMKKTVKSHMIRTKITAELLSTEKNYCKDLMIVVDEFYTPLNSILSQQQLDTLFSNIKEIVSVHTKFVDLLESRMESWGYHACVADTVVPFVEEFKCYETYINNYKQASEFLASQVCEDTAAAKFIKKKTSSKMCRGLQLTDFLIMPIQRLPRIILLLKELIKYTPNEHPDMPNCQQAHDKMSGVAELLNMSRRNADNREKFLTIKKSISGLDLPAEHGREFVHEGTLEEVVAVKNRRSILPSSSQEIATEKVGYYIFMFNDVLLCAKRLSAPARVMKNLGRKEATYQFSTPSLIPFFESTNAKIDETAENAFRIEYIDPEDADNLEKRIFCASSEKERDQWIQMINNRGKPAKP